MKIGILGATEDEMIPLLARMSEVTTQTVLQRNLHHGFLHGFELYVVAGGVGKVNAAITAQLLILQFGVEKLFVCGVAGGLSSELKIGDVIIGTEIVHHDLPMELAGNGQFPIPLDGFVSDPDLVALCHGRERVHFGRIITGDRFIAGPEREDLIQRFDPLCVDMESAAVAQVCWFYELPLLVIRCLSDTAEDDAMDTYETHLQHSCCCAVDVLELVLKKLSLR